MSVSSQFRYDISFLRAFSVLAVVLYHFKIPGFNGGFVGVDVFFVISGFLMTKIILTGLEKATFELIEFYGKRVTRIVPALLTMILLVGLAIYMVLPVQFLSYIRNASASTLFLSNIQYYLLNGYFSSDAQTNFLLHTWSLSVEWQFYIIFPLILWPLKKWYTGRDLKFYGFYGVLLTLSFVGMLVATSQDPSFSFYMFVTRAWEMMLGGAVFLLPICKWNSKIKSSISLLCLFILSLAVYAIDDTKLAWPSLWTLIPVLAATLLLYTNTNFKFYKTKTVQFLGDTSYSFYLWHWPLYVFTVFFGLNSEPLHKTIFIFISFIFAIASYYSVERYRNYTHSRVALVSFTLAGFLLFSYFKIPNLLFIHSETADLAITETKYNDGDQMEEQYRYGTHHLTDEQLFSEYDKKLLIPVAERQNIVLLGDSHAGMFAKSLVESLPEYNIIQATADAAFPIPHSANRFQESVKFFNYFYEVYFPKNFEQIDLVVISSNYVAHNPELSQYVADLTTYFKKFGVDYIFVGQTPTYAFNYPTVYYLKDNFKIYSEDNLRKKRFNDGVNSKLKSLLKDQYIDILHQNIKPISDEGEPYLYDGGHLSYYGAQQYMPTIQQAILRRLKVNKEN